jgi:hypothetical protein
MLTLAPKENQTEAKFNLFWRKELRQKNRVGNTEKITIILAPEVPKFAHLDTCNGTCIVM